MDLEGKAENRTVELTVSNDELAAGFFLGCNVRLYFNIILDENTPIGSGTDGIPISNCSGSASQCSGPRSGGHDRPYSYGYQAGT